jgi:hypothetical protein
MFKICHERINNKLHNSRLIGPFSLVSLNKCFTIQIFCDSILIVLFGNVTAGCPSIDRPPKLQFCPSSRLHAIETKTKQ